MSRVEAAEALNRTSSLDQAVIKGILRSPIRGAPAKNLKIDKKQNNCKNCKKRRGETSLAVERRLEYEHKVQ